jgi:LmbE family N-acetylglucosaminyl deacetylase
MASPTFQCLLVISPHCDDAVLSCGRLLESHPGSVVVTVFAGTQPADQPLTDWDRAAGFKPGEDVMAHRRHEDRRALSLLNCDPIWLPFHDSQYQVPACRDEIRRALQNVIEVIRPHVLLLPWGLFHSDHILAHEAGMDVRASLPDLPWLLYEDSPYRRIPDLLMQRLADSRNAGLHIKRVMLGPTKSLERKAAAIACYESQLKALTTPGRPGYLDAFEEERFWYISPTRRNDRHVSPAR